VQQLRSQCHLPVSTARVARLAASFFSLPSKPVTVANSKLSFRRILVMAPLVLRKSRCSEPRELPGSKAIKLDAVDSASFAHGFAILCAKAAPLLRHLLRR